MDIILINYIKIYIYNIQFYRPLIRVILKQNALDKLLPKGRRMPALAQSTRDWWNIRPWLHLETENAGFGKYCLLVISGSTWTTFELSWLLRINLIYNLFHLLSGLLMRMMDMRATLAMTPIPPRLVRIMADSFWSWNREILAGIWETWEQECTGVTWAQE